MECRGGWLIRGRARQDGRTPLFIAAQNGHQEVVQLLVKAGADKDAPLKVNGEEGVGYWAHKQFLFSLLGVAARPLTASVLSRVG